MQNRVVGVALCVIGGLVGGALGYWAFFWIVRQGFYALMLPGALVGLGSSALARQPCRIRGVVCGLAALVLGLYTDWGFEKFQEDRSFTYFLTHVHKLEPLTLIMIVAGALLAFWLGKDASPLGRSQKPPVHREEQGPAQENGPTR